MDLKFNLKDAVMVNNVSELDAAKGFRVLAFTGKPFGKLSNTVSISIEDSENDENYIAFSLNKNQAIYLSAYLKAFSEELDIDIDDVD